MWLPQKGFYDDLVMDHVVAPQGFYDDLVMGHGSRFMVHVYCHVYILSLFSNVKPGLLNPSFCLIVICHYSKHMGTCCSKHLVYMYFCVQHFVS